MDCSALGKPKANWQLWLVVVLTVAAFSFWHRDAHAQAYALMNGTVTDPTGAVIPHASVIATDSLTGAQTKTIANADGEYTFPTLMPAHYTITASARGFKAYKHAGIVLQANQSLTVNITLQLGASTQTVNVSGAPPQLDTTNGTLSQVIGHRSIMDLPLGSRNAADLILLTAGVANAGTNGQEAAGINEGDTKTFPSAVVTSSDGTLPNQENYLLDGGNNVDETTNVNDPFPFPDALQEFSVQTTNYNAEYGQSAGAEVNIVTKAGTNHFHGDLFEYLRNTYFDARPYFAVSPTILNRNQFGGVIGGPAIIPHLLKGRKTQFFFGYQRTLDHQASSAGSSIVPTLAEEGRANGENYADFSNLCDSAQGNTFNNSGVCVDSAGNPVPSEQIRNPFTNQSYPYNHIPDSAINPAALAFEKAFPTYNGAVPAGQIGGIVHFNLPTIRNTNEFIGRVDHQFGAHDHIFFRYFYDFFNAPGVYNPKNLLDYLTETYDRYQNAAISETHIFSPTVVNNLVLNYQREYSVRGGPPGSPSITNFGVNNIYQYAADGPYLNVNIGGGYFGVTGSAAAIFGRNDYNLNDVLNWVKGKHNFAFGGHVELSKFDAVNLNAGDGNFSFAPVDNRIEGTTYTYPNSVANFEMGFMSSFTQGNAQLVNDRGHFPAIFAQDTWRLTPRLTVDYGIRWEMFEPWADHANKQTFFNPARYAADEGTPQYDLSTSAGTAGLPAGMVISGDPGYPQYGLNSKYAHFMPRLGFAYDLFGNGKTVVRGGFGEFYQDRMQAWMNLSQASDVPNTISLSLTNPGMYSPAAGANPGGPFNNPYCTGCTASEETGTPVHNPFPYTKPFPKSQVFPNAFTVAEYNPNTFHTPVTYAWNLSVQRQITPNTMVQLGYVATASRHQEVDLERNPAVNNGAPIGTNYRRPYNTAPTVGPCTTTVGCQTSYAFITEGSMSGSASYNSFQATLQKRMSQGLSLLANFTWSHTLDDLPLTMLGNTEDIVVLQSYVYPLYPKNAVGIPAAARVQNIKALDTGNAAIDHPFVFNVSYVYQLPKLHAGNPFMRALANGWTTSGVISTQSGDALTVIDAFVDNSLTGELQDRAERKFSLPAYQKGAGRGNCPAGTPCYNWYNPKAFSVPVQDGPGTGFGNVVKGSLRGPRLFNWNADVLRNFPVFHESYVQFRAEYYDVLNNAEFQDPNFYTQPTPGNPSFGSISGTAVGSESNYARYAQFALKYVF
jgi:hypothetical protein